ncbi:hypothetical protein HanRHA438_Chr17g0813201 [Helianthus annuus]|nr:hypothetical protein HanIR_Chr17g0871171 [Helianthus annuus]KAJ0447558.1 hypothetical protein HanHA89_Chr17g0706721 [Helianthus annuus]KAJ0632465.1 hypothetical protein HanLR1_Chr17g0665411 [Helianthus annuus]KAJ0826339.1 hypothetical protein HanRHA438_Chr17g0813201 [Helianthus annuus]
MIRSMEEEFQRIVGVSGPLWGFVVAFMLFNVRGMVSKSRADYSGRALDHTP